MSDTEVKTVMVYMTDEGEINLEEADRELLLRVIREMHEEIEFLRRQSSRIVLELSSKLWAQQ